MERIVVINVVYIVIIKYVIDLMEDVCLVVKLVEFVIELN